MHSWWPPVAPRGLQNQSRHRLATELDCEPLVQELHAQ